MLVNLKKPKSTSNTALTLRKASFSISANTHIVIIIQWVISHHPLMSQPSRSYPNHAPCLPALSQTVIITVLIRIRSQETVSLSNPFHMPSLTKSLAQQMGYTVWLPPAAHLCPASFLTRTLPLILCLTFVVKLILRYKIFSAQLCMNFIKQKTKPKVRSENHRNPIQSLKKKVRVHERKMNNWVVKG